MAFGALGLVVFGAAIALLVHRGSRLAVAWGAAWGIVGGFWLVAPVLRGVHYLQPTALRHWVVLNTFLLVCFAGWGAVLTLVVTIPRAFWAMGRRREFRNPVWAYAIWAVAWLPIAYLGMSALIDWTNMNTRPQLGPYAATFRPLAPFHAALVLLLVAIYLLRAARGWDGRGRLLAGVVGAAAVVGCVAGPLAAGLTSAPLTSSGDPPPLKRATATPRAPLLVVGFDGGTWRAVRPVIDRGKAPTLARLAATGMQGIVPALWPPYWSTPAWSALTTGHSAEENRVHEDLGAEAPGLPAFELPLQLNTRLNPMFAIEFGLVGAGVLDPVPTPRSLLTWPPVWERLSKSGVTTAVVRMPFTYPAAGRADYVISNRIATDLWGALGVQPGDRDKLVAPADDAASWLAWFGEGQGGDEKLVRELLPQIDWQKPADAFMAPAKVLRQELRIRQQISGVSKAMLRKHREISVLMQYIGTFDPLCHAFWQYRFPEDFPDDPPAPADVDVLGPIIDRYIELFDRQLGELIATFPSPPNVIVVSDHGAGPVSTFRTVWRGEHASPGMFLAGGPDIPHRSEMLEVSYYDVVPTILDLEGFEKPVDLVGRSVMEPDRAAGGQ